MDAMADCQAASRTYFRPTTVSQRQFLFRVAEETGNVSEAARRAHVSRGTYYHWQSRYRSAGNAGLAREESRAPHHPRISPVSAELRAEVLAYWREHQKEGYRSVADGLGKSHGWQKVIGHTKVGEIIREARAGESLPVSPGEKPAISETATTVVHAPQPNETINIDLCVVPVTHDGTRDLASVSLSAAAAGVSDAIGDNGAARSWPGQVFTDTDLPYEEQMRRYEQGRRAKRASRGQRKHLRRQKQGERGALLSEEEELRAQRRRQRLLRRQVDAAWRGQRKAYREARKARQKATKQERRQSRIAWEAQQAQWRAGRTERRAQSQQRQVEDAAWRQARQVLRTKRAELAMPALPVTTWWAILVVVDNCTRRCLSLPLFTTGVHVTAEEVVAALQAICIAQLRFVISDNGKQFTADAFAHLAEQKGFLHVRIAPYRAKSNGIAERFVQTLKEWLSWHAWINAEGLAALLAEFLAYYNDRPHQGAELAGLSPNEFARRLNCSRC